jgi:hypothetical protein
MLHLKSFTKVDRISGYNRRLFYAPPKKTFLPTSITHIKPTFISQALLQRSLLNRSLPSNWKLITANSRSFNARSDLDQSHSNSYKNNRDRYWHWSSNENTKSIPSMRPVSTRHLQSRLV